MSSKLDFSSLSSIFKSPVPPDFETVRDPAYAQQTLRSSTVFSGDPDEWVAYLNTPWKDRRNHPLFMDVEIDRERKHLAFHPRNTDSEIWATRFNRGFEIITHRLESHKRARKVYHELLF